VSLTSQDIAAITKLLEDSAFDELELELNGMKIHLRRGAPAGAAPQPATRVEPGDVPAIEPGLAPVRAPLLGTFYRAPKPGAPPFVDVGAKVEPDTIVGIIEVMKLMNTVRAGVHGVVRAIPARDGMLVEYGEILALVALPEPR
jgi:acetyl-CoA carboxylase biotin carboxyl carrier protein